MAAAALVLCAGLVRADDQHVVSLTCRGMEVQKAISILQTVSDLRVVVDPKVPHKRITLSLKDLPPEDALRTIVAAAGLSYRRAGNAFLVQTLAGSAVSTGPTEPDGGARGGTTNPPVPGIDQGGIVRPDQPQPAPGGVGSGALHRAPVPVAPAVLAALEHIVDVDVKNGPLTEVMAQLSHSAGTEVTADAGLSDGLLATVGLHGIPLKSALEMVAGQTGLQISPRSDGVAFVSPGLSLDAAQARNRHAPTGAKHVDQGQLWTAEWANVLTSGFSAFDGTNPFHSLRRQSFHPGGGPLEFKPRSGGQRLGQPAVQPAHTLRRGNVRSKKGVPATPASRRTSCSRLIPVKSGVRCAKCGHVLAPGVHCCSSCTAKLAAGDTASARCPACRHPSGSR